MHTIDVASEGYHIYGQYTGPSPMALYKLSGENDAGEPVFEKACSAIVYPHWQQVMILLKLSPSGSVVMTVVDASLVNLPKGMISIVNYTPSPMNLRFGAQDIFFDVAPMSDVKIPLNRLDENYYAVVQALVRNPKTGKLVKVFDDVWTMNREYRAIFILEPHARKSGYLQKRRIMINEFRMTAPDASDEGDD